MGQEERNGIIEDLENDKNFMILIIGEGQKPNWQLPKEVINYVKENYEYIGYIDVFSVYEKGIE